MSNRNRGVDVFADIAAQKQNLRSEKLIEPTPETIPEFILPEVKHNPRAAFKPKPKIDTAEKLQGELKKQQRKYSRFMQVLTPKHKTTRSKKFLSQFEYQLAGGTEWERVDIPHYGAPLGRAYAYYRTQFTVTKAMRDKGSVFVCFKGVDYRAEVFVNDEYLGSHEGFFAPFEFECTEVCKIGENALLIKVKNDAICMGNESWGTDGYKYEGDKIYAATGPGYDEPEVGWHHCPPGMGIYQDVFVEARSAIHIHDIFVRPLPAEGRAEAWIEIFNCGIEKEDVYLELSLFGQNFRKTVFRDKRFDVEYAGPTVNYYRLAFDIPDAKIWELNSPWLYQIQVSLLNKKGKTLDISSRSFGMRSFEMDEKGKVKGRFYLNGREIRLRGANTMGHMQQCVIHKNWGQLRDDILLAKICNMNFFRLTQRPVQPEIYDYCDMLGMMTQTDLPLFAVLRRNQFCEAVRQAGEMEKLVRSHPCNVISTYINEPSPLANGKPHRHLTRDELESFFSAADKATLLANPDRVIKPVDGDYDPPAPGLPDNHCYCGWYNGHGIDIGKLHRGYWQRVKPGWFYGCGEFGSEGLDFPDIMRKYYPKHWLAKNKKEESQWSPYLIPRAQTGNFHYMWFDTADSLEEWSLTSQKHQAWATRLMTEAFRRDRRMVSFAIHLSIDAFPSNWMKTIMDFRRQPKPAYFAYREALTPLMISLRTDRYRFFAGENIEAEVWICNDLNDAPAEVKLHYQLEMEGKVIRAGKSNIGIPLCSSQCVGRLRFEAPTVEKRTPLTIRAGLIDRSGKSIYDNCITADIFTKPKRAKQTRRIVVLGSKSQQLAEQLGLQNLHTTKFHPNDCILIDDYSAFDKNRKEIMRVVRGGAIVIFLELSEGNYKIAGSMVENQKCGMNPRHFVSRKTSHPIVSDFKPDDFKFWFDESSDMVTPLLDTTFISDDFTPILTSGNGQWGKDLWYPTLAAGEKKYGAGIFRICQVKLAGRVNSNCPARIFAERLLELM